MVVWFIMRKSSYTYDDLIASGRGTLFGPNFAKLPLPNMLMMDRIPEVSETGGKNGKGFIAAELDVKPDMWFFQCHFEGDPVMPGCLGLDALWQLLGFYMTWKGMSGKGRALGVGEVKFRGQVLPTNKTVRYEVHISRMLDSKLKLGIADGFVFVDGQEIYKANSLRVGLFDDPSTF